MDLVPFITNHSLLVAAAVGLAAMIVYTEIRHLTRPFTALRLVQAVQLPNADAVGVDAPSQDRLQSGHIAGARDVPFERLDEEAEKRLGQAKERPIIIYCDNGLTGARAASLLAKHGFSKVYNLRGGLEAWRRESYPLERK